ncbi:hypothetical protein [Pygmaiobacter massiliensis]|uniref:hypothetical protein n=1 Tax=Pygmaiobacter massiliensis TaxID=1917873 RepID=UPI000C7B1C5F|nr:hypothetical protein [Pygmaiobacter massiliensis]
MHKPFLKQHGPHPFAQIVFFFAVWLLCYHTLAGGTLLAPNIYDSYSLQAQSWLTGRMDLETGAHYSWLELAIFDGRYYVSFPPLPSVVCLPFVALVGAASVPANLLCAIYLVCAAAGVYRAFCITGHSAEISTFWATALVFAGNGLELARMGGVWNQAQLLNLALCCWGVAAFFANRRSSSLFCFALAVGCRPFSALFLILTFLLFYRQDRLAGKSHYTFLQSLWPGLLGTALIAAVLMWYNFARFGSPFEFGHNFLPEFVQSTHGQFNLVYLWQNLCNIFRPVTLNSGLALQFPRFDGFLFLLANPVFIIFFIHLARPAPKPLHLLRWAAVAGFTLNLLALCVHKTFGGWQFGARYTVDLLPYALLFLAREPQRPVRWWEKDLCTFGLLFNAFGSIYMMLDSRHFFR